MPQDFMPHGYCFLWNPLVLWLHVISDALIASSYYCIPIALVYFIRKNREIPFSRIFWMFGAFILACGTTHLMEIWNIWHASYLLAGAIKAVTAGVSVLTAAMLIPLVPKAISVPERIHLMEVNQKLEREVAERTRFDVPMESTMRRKVTYGFIFAVLLTVFLGISSWRGAQQAELDAYWVSHTHEVMETIQRTLRSVIEAETSARAFALSGEEPLLAHYESAHEEIYRNEDELRHLTVDNPEQQRRMDELQSRVGDALQFADRIIAKRRHARGGYAGADADAMATEGRLMSVRSVTQEMYGAEEGLLVRRRARIESGRRWARDIAVLGILLGAILWTLARLAVNREIAVSERARAQLNILNAELERRVEQRTAALRLEIAERERMAEARERLAAVVESSDDAIISKTLQGVITTWNRGAQKVFGYSPEEAVGQPMLMLIPPERAEEEADILERIGRGESIDHFETVRVRKDGSRIQIAATVSPIRDRSGRVIGASKIARDITEQKQAQESIAEQAEELGRQADELLRSRQDLERQSLLLQSVLDSMAEGLIVADEQGQFVIWNPAAEKILGRGAARVPPPEWSKHYQVYLSDKVTPFPADQLTLARAVRGEVSMAEMFVRNPAFDEGVWIEVSGGPLTDASGLLRGGVVAFRDITKRKADEHEIRTLNDELEQRVMSRTAQLEAANKELEAFSYSVSHDLRAPLRHMSGFSKILSEDYGSSLPEDAQRHLQRIEEGAKRMGQLVDELLNLTRVGRQTIAVQTIELEAVVEDVIAMLEPETRGLPIEWKISPLPVVACDAVLIRQVFQNLIGNALKYSRQRSPAVIEIGQSEKDGQTVIFVKDNGVGFNMKYADKLFGVFQRLHGAEEFEGIGVGLATVRRIVQKHGGRAWAEAEVGRGSIFYFTLSGSGQSAPAVSAPRNAAATAGGQP